MAAAHAARQDADLADALQLQQLSADPSPSPSASAFRSSSSSSSSTLSSSSSSSASSYTADLVGSALRATFVLFSPAFLAAVERIAPAQYVDAAAVGAFLVLCCPGLCSVVLCCVVLCCALLSCPVLCCSVVLSCAVLLCCPVLCCAILFSVVLIYLLTRSTQRTRQFLVAFFLTLSLSFVFLLLLLLTWLSLHAMRTCTDACMHAFARGRTLALFFSHVLLQA